MTLSVYSMMRYLEAREMSPVNSLQPLPYSKSRAAEKHHHQRSENTFAAALFLFRLSILLASTLAAVLTQTLCLSETSPPLCTSETDADSALLLLHKHQLSVPYKRQLSSHPLVPNLPYPSHHGSPTCIRCNDEPGLPNHVSLQQATAAT